MASAKLQKPTNETSSNSHEEHKFSQKVTAWGGKVFGHKHQEHQLGAKHCNTCQCPAPQNGTKPAHTVHVKDTKKEKEGHAPAAHKDAKHFSCIELKKREKQHVTNAATKDPKQPVSAVTKSHTATASNTMTQKQHKDEPGSHWYSNMTENWKEKIMKKKAKDGKEKYSSSSSSDSESEDEASAKKKQMNKKHTHETKTTSK